MNLAEHLDQWLLLDEQEAKIAYLMENADTLMSEEAENELKQRLAAATTPDEKNRLQECLDIREALKSYVGKSHSPVEKAVLDFLRAETEEDARIYALANKDLLLTAMGQTEIDSYPESERVDQRQALLRQLRLELVQPVKLQRTSVEGIETEERHTQFLSSDGETISTRKTLTCEYCQFGDNNVMINHIERVPLAWIRPKETGKKFWEGAVGRNKELSDLHQKLIDEQQCSLLSVHGLPAIGKSTLAALYAHRYVDQYPGGIIWLQYYPHVTTSEQAKTELRRAARFAYNANPEAIEILDEKYAVEPDVVQALLSGHGRLLIIVDDVWNEEVALTVKEALPEDAHVILTTRDHDVAGAFVNHKARAMVELDVLTEADARLLLAEIAPDLPDDVVEKLVRGLDGHAQALTIAGYTLQRNAWKGADGMRADCGDILHQVSQGAGFGNLPEVKDDLRKRIRKFEAVLKYSYERLAEAFDGGKINYQPYFRALGTLAEGADFSAEAFTALCQVDDGAPILNELRCSGLVKTVSSADGASTRWQQHAILRSYALSLQTAEEKLDLPQRHAEYFARILRESESAHQVYQMYDELANLRQAFNWSVVQNFSLADDLLQNMSDVFRGFNLGEEHFQWAQKLFEAASRQDDRGKLVALMRRAVASANLSRVEATLEGRRKRLLNALDDYNQALPLREGVPSEKASTLNNRANVQIYLAPLEATLEGRRKRLLDALTDVWHASSIFSSLGLHQYVEVSQNVLLRTAVVCGFSLFRELWREITGEDTIPEFELLSILSEFSRVEEIGSYKQFGQRLEENEEFNKRFEDVMQLANEYQSSPNIDSANTNELQAMEDLLIEWVKTQDWEASEQFLLEHREKLLNDHGLQALQLLIKLNNGDTTQQQHLQILQHAIEDGIEAVYTELKKTPFEQKHEITHTFAHISNNWKTQAIIAMSLVLGERFLRQEDIPRDHLEQFIEDFETVILAKAEASGEAQLLDGCKRLLGRAYNSLHVQYDYQKDYPAALAAADKAIAYQPEQAMYYRNRAGTYLEMKDYLNALPDLEAAQSLDGDNPRLARLWHDCLVGMGQTELLLDKIASLIEKHTDQAHIHYYVALAHAYLHHDEAAMTAMRDSSRLANDDQRASGVATLEEIREALPDFTAILSQLKTILEEKPHDKN